MRSFFNIDPPRNLFSSPAAILYQLDRHELIEAAAGSQDAIEAFLSHKVEAQNLLKLSLDDDLDDAVRFLGGKINPVGSSERAAEILQLETLFDEHDLAIWVF